MLKQRIAPVRRVVVGVALHVVVQPVGELVSGAPGVPRLDGLEPAGGRADPSQPVVLHIVADLHREQDVAAQNREDQGRPRTAHPEQEPVPEDELHAVAPERVRMVPHRQLATRQAAAFEPPGPQQVVRHLLGQVSPEAQTLRRRPRVQGRAYPRMMNVDVLGRIVRVGDGSQQELAEATLPESAAVDQLVADDEDRLSHHRENHGHAPDFPQGQMIGNQSLPEREDERDRPEHRP